MNEKMKKALSKVRTGCYLLPCFLVAGGAFLAGSDRVSETFNVELETYDISKVEEVLKAQAQAEHESSQKAKSAAVKGKTSEKDERSSKHGEAQTFLDGTYEGMGVGFAGKIKVKVVVEDSKIVSIEVTEIEADDAPFVAKAKGVIESILQYQTMDVDTVSGATYSSKGIIAAVRNALEGVEDTSEVAPQKGKPAPTALPAFEDAQYKDGVYYGTGTGFGGEVKVKVVIAQGKITEIAVESAGGEDGSYLARAKTLLAKVIEKQSPNVDTVSGATYTSNGIISAVQHALSQAKQNSDKAESKNISEKNQERNETYQESNTEETTGYQDGVYKGMAKGFRGDVEATVTVKNKKISDITIVSKDDESFLKKAMTLIEVIKQKQTAEGIDVVTGATYSSNGIINSVKEALKKAVSNTRINKEEVDIVPSPTAKPLPLITDVPQPTSAGEEGDKNTYKDGTYQGKALGFNDNVTVEVSIQNGSISQITIKEYKDDEEFFWEAYSGVSAQILNKQTTEGVDVVSGATYSSKGIINAVKKALEQAKE